MKEDFLTSNIDRSLEKQKRKGETYLRKSEEIIKSQDPAERINEESFDDVYSSEEIKRDTDKIAEMEDKHQSNNPEDANEYGKRYADVLETVITKAGEDNEWFGSDTKISRASKFDDYFNGTDLIFELGDSENLLAVDLTYSKGWSEVSNKIKRIKEEIDTNKLTDLKYFESKVSKGEKGFKNKVPKVVVALSFEDLTKVTRLWSAEFAEIPESAKEFHKKMLKDSSIQVEILQQIISQLETFINYSEKNDKEEFVSIFSKLLEKLKEVSHSARVEKIIQKLKDKGKVLKEDGQKLGRTEELDNHLEREFFFGKAA